MKFRYFLRGLGFGIVFTAIICLTAYQGNPNAKITDDEIIRRAKALGMVETEDKVGGLLEKNKEDTEAGTTTEENTAVDKTEAKDTQTDTTEEKTNPKDEKKSSETTEEPDTEKDQQEEDGANQSADTVILTIERGTSSYPICQRLQELGMIADASDFDTYLVENGYASRIRVGEHTLRMGMSYSEIAEAISDPL